MRLIDAEQFEVISWSAQGQRGDYARGYDDGVQYVAAKIDHTPTIDAIPVEWLLKWPKDFREGAYIRDILRDWQKYEG